MVVLSVLRPSLQKGRSVLLKTCSLAQLLSSPVKAQTVALSVRQMSGPRKMVIKPSRFEWERWKDDLHFYAFLGLVPMALLIFYANVFVGPAEFSDIPEDYEPKHWEYYQSPIIRFMARHVYDSPEKIYEVTLHVLHEENEQRKFNILDQKVRHLMDRRQDYKGWYYVPMLKHRTETAREWDEYTKDYSGSKS